MAADPLLLSGVVTDRNGRPVAGARVALATAPVAMPDIAALSGDDGRFSFGVPMAGRYEVQAFGDSGSAVASVQVGPDTAEPVRLVLD